MAPRMFEAFKAGELNAAAANSTPQKWDEPVRLSRACSRGDVVQVRSSRTSAPRA